jgi:hypothetical protein
MTDESGELFTVHVRLGWLPERAGGVRGRLLAVRGVGTPGDTPVVEFWLSAPAEMEIIGDPATPEIVQGWRQFLLGRPLAWLGGPPPLEPADLAGLRSIERRWACGPCRPLLDVAAAVRATRSRAVFEYADVAAVDAEVLAHAVRPTVETALDSLTVAGPGTGRPDPADQRLLWPDRRIDRDRQLRAALRERIELHDVSGAQVGDHNIQINRFVVRSPRVDLDLNAVLRRSDVQGAMRALQADPTNASLRQEVVDRLASTGLSFESRPARLTAGEVRRGWFADFLRRLLLFDVRGLQVGDHNTQRNTFVCAISDTVKGAELLRGRPDLARALTDYVCPRDTGGSNLAMLQRSFRAEIESLPLDWTDDRDRGVRLAPPGALDVLRVNRTDALTVGRDNIMRVEELVEIEVVHIAATPAPTWVSTRARRVARDLPVPPVAQRAEERTAHQPARERQQQRQIHLGR